MEECTSALGVRLICCVAELDSVSCVSKHHTSRSIRSFLVDFFLSSKIDHTMCYNSQLFLKADYDKYDISKTCIYIIRLINDHTER